MLSSRKEAGSDWQWCDETQRDAMRCQLAARWVSCGPPICSSLPRLLLPSHRIPVTLFLDRAQNPGWPIRSRISSSQTNQAAYKMTHNTTRATRTARLTNTKQKLRWQRLRPATQQLYGHSSWLGSAARASSHCYRWPLCASCVPPIPSDFKRAMT